MKPSVKELLTDDLVDLSYRFGRASAGREPSYFHTSRAKQTLDVVLLANPARGDSEVVNRLVHLAAVCVRLAMALNGEETS